MVTSFYSDHRKGLVREVKDGDVFVQRNLPSLQVQLGLLSPEGILPVNLSPVHIPLYFPAEKDVQYSHKPCIEGFEKRVEINQSESASVADRQ